MSAVTRTLRSPRRRGSSQLLTIAGVALILVSAALIALVVAGKPRSAEDRALRDEDMAPSSGQAFEAPRPTAEGSPYQPAGEAVRPPASGAGESALGGDSDRDGDGTPDAKDGCPDDPRLQAAPVWFADHDGDGVGDPAERQASCRQPSASWIANLGRAGTGDRCPRDPRKVEPGDCGCGVPDVDANKNGISDCKEKNDGPLPRGSSAQVRVANNQALLAGARNEILTMLPKWRSGRVPVETQAQMLAQYLANLYDLHQRFSEQFAEDLGKASPGIPVPGGGFIVALQRDVASEGPTSAGPRRCDIDLLDEWEEIVVELRAHRKYMYGLVEFDVSQRSQGTAAERQRIVAERWSELMKISVPATLSRKALTLDDLCSDSKFGAELDKIQRYRQSGARR